MLKIEFTGQFKRDFKLALKRGCDSNEFQKVVSLLASEQPLPEKYRDHPLENSRNYRGVRECHIQPDWLLIWEQNDTELILLFLDTGSHSDIF